MFDISKLNIRQLMELRVQVNDSIALSESNALAKIAAGGTAKGYTMSKGKVSRFINDKPAYHKVLHNAFGDTFDELCMTHAIIPLTAAEKLIKENFDKEDAAEIKEQLNETLDKKTSAPKLTYIGDN